MSLLELKGITKIYGEKESLVYGLSNVDFKLEPGESIAVTGTSGSGKSTFLNILGLIDKPTEGEYFIRGSSTSHFSGGETARLRNQFFGFVMQDFALIPHYTVERNVQIPMDYTSALKAEKKEKVLHVLESLHIADKRKSYPAQLSGGQKQRAAIARALINDPEVLLCDEPTGALDSVTSREIMEIFQKLNDEGKTVILVTHDRNAASYCKRQVKIEDGRLYGGQK